ncbi:hypothetical protein [Deinococcus pimensis]|uniref:hypothetical protein n=1 Tax=Deinococcus pimensis TaxID=309888 RepID=UPI0004882208|nr:hypothetical protein [Deinococcus pimensis]
MARTKPQVFPAVSGTITVTAGLALAELPNMPVGTRDTLTAAVAEHDPELDELYAYAHENQLGEHGENWKGRRPANDDIVTALPLLVMDDQIGPALAREVDAQFAKPPEWDAVQEGTNLPPENELVKVMADWADFTDLTGTAKDAARARFWAGRMLGRAYVPEEYADVLANPRTKPTTLADALALVHVQAIDPREGGPLVDPHKRVLGYWYRYESTLEGRAVTLVEVHLPRQVLTFRQLDRGKLELLRGAVNPFANAQTDTALRRAEYLMWHMDRDGGTAITKSVRHAQDRLNCVVTYMAMNDDQTGYRQFIVSNAEQPRDRAGKPVPFPMGPGVALNLRGLPIDAVKQDPNSKPSRHTPTWEVLDPLNPEEFHVPSIKKWVSSILEKLDQQWTQEMDSQVSGESKRQSRKPFDRRVAFAGQDMGLFIAWALRAALMLAAQMLGQTETYRAVTFVPKVFLDVDAVNLEELRVKLQMWQAGALTLTTLLESTPGVPDAAKEEQALKERQTDPTEQARRKLLDDLLGNDNRPGGTGGVGGGGGDA